MPNIIFNIPLYFTGITMAYAELAPKLTATVSVAQLVERWSSDSGSRVQFPARGLGVALFAAGPSCTVAVQLGPDCCLAVPRTTSSVGLYENLAVPRTAKQQSR